MMLNPLPIAPRPLSLRADRVSDGYTTEGVEYRTFDLVRQRGGRIHYLASITVYADGSQPLVMARAHEPSDANVKARQTARDYFQLIDADTRYSGAYWAV